MTVNDNELQRKKGIRDPSDNGDKEAHFEWTNNRKHDLTDLYQMLF